MDRTLFEKTAIPKAYFTLSLPTVLSMVVSIIYNMADTFFIAQTQNTNLVAGVSLGAPVFTLLMAFGNIFGQGGCSLMSRLLGQRNQQSIQHVSSFCFYGAFATGLIAAIIMIGFQNPILLMLGANEQSFSYAREYYLWLSIGAPFLVVSFVHCNLLRSVGLSKESMIGSIGGAVINIILDPILISGFHLGAQGAAIATVTGYLFTDGYYIYTVLKKCSQISLNLRKIPISRAEAGQIFGIGIPAALTNLMQSLSIIFVNQALLPYGNDKIAAMGIALKVSSIAILLLVGFSFGGQPLIGYLYGAKDYSRLRALLKLYFQFIGGLSALLTIGIFVLAPVLIPLFLSDTNVIEQGIPMLRLQVISMIFVALVQIIMIWCQSSGKMLISFLLSISRQGVIFFLVLFLSTKFFGYDGIIAAQAISDLITAGIAVFFYFISFHQELKKDHSSSQAS
ncbi:MAG: MATE family efflux transporter [Massiliimalia sp.]|jgi:multidrug efflux pump